MLGVRQGNRTLAVVAITVLLVCQLAARASGTADGQYEPVGNNRFCNHAGDCYTKEHLPSGVVRYCRDGGGCRYMSAAQNVACPRGYTTTESGSCQIVRAPPNPSPQPQGRQHSGRARSGENRRDRESDRRDVRS